MPSPRSGVLVLALALTVPVSASAQLAASPVEIDAPRAGDAGIYEATHVDVEGTDADPVDPIAFQLGEPRFVDDAYGESQAAWPLVLAIPPDPARRSTVEDRPRVAWMTDLGLAPMAQTEAHERVREGIDQGLLAENEHREWAGIESTRYAHGEQTLHGPACLLTPTWPASPLEEGRQLDLDRFCGEPVAAELQALGGNASARVAEVVERSGEPPALRLDVTMGADTTRANLEIWYTPDIPYPRQLTFEIDLHEDVWVHGEPGSVPEDAIVQTVVGHPLNELLGFPGHLRGPVDEDGDDWARFEGTLELTAFDRGDGPALSPGEQSAWPSRRAQAPVEPVDRWGPPIGSLELPFARDHAVEALQTDPRLEEFHAWQAEHPDHRAVVTSFRLDEDTDPPTASWHFVVTAPDGSSFQLTSTKRIVDTGDTLAGPAGPPPIENFASRDEDPWPAQVPNRSVTAASAVEVWEDVWADRVEADDPNRLRWQAWHETHRYDVTWVNRSEQTEEDPTTDERHTGFHTVSVRSEDGAMELRGQSLFRDAEGRLGASAPEPTPAPWDPPDTVPSADAETVPSLDDRLGIGVGALLLALLARFGLVPLYNGLTREELLDHHTRRRIYELLEDEPQTASTIATRTGVARSTVRHHLRKLAEGGLVDHRQAGGEVLWFPQGTVPAEDIEREAVLSTGRSRDVYHAIRESPGASLQQVAEHTDLRAPSVQRIVERLVAEGLVEKEREGRTLALRPA